MPKTEWDMQDFPKETAVWFPARYPGECSNCSGDFDEGDDIRADGSGGWECCEPVQMIRSKEEVCGRCNIVKPCWC